MRKLTAFIALLLCAAFTFALDGTAVSVKGKVEIQGSNGEWVALKQGDKIPEGAVISTGFKSEADIKLGGSVVTVRQLTRITLRELTEGEDKITTDLFLDAGAVDANVKPLNNKANGFQIQSSVVTSSVRGTNYSVDALGNETTHEGSVYNQSASGSYFTANAGESVGLEENVLINPYSEVEGGVTVQPVVVSPAEKAISPLQIAGGPFGEGVVNVPGIGFADVTSVADYELSSVVPAEVDVSLGFE